MNTKRISFERTTMFIALELGTPTANTPLASNMTPLILRSPALYRRER